MPATKKTKTKKATAIPARKVKKSAAPKSAGGKKARATKPTPAAETSAPPKQTTISITAAKGRPMLSWVGKRPLRHVTAFPAQHIESFNPTAEPPGNGGLLFHGDNKEVLAHLLANGFRGKVNLIYIDPPYDSGADYVRKVSLRGSKITTEVDGENYTLGEQIQYTDIWANDNYLQFMFERLMLLKELLADTGSIYLHCDWHKSHHLRCLIEEVFGPDNFKNDIVWQRFNYRADGLKFGTVHDTILFSTKSNSYFFAKPYVSLKPSYIKSHFRPDATGRLFRLDNLTAPAHGKLGKPLRFGDRMIAPPSGTMWRHAQEGIDDLWKKKLIEIPDDGVPQVKRYLDEIEGQAVHSIWTDLSSINSQSTERSDYPTQKPESLIERILETSTKPGDVVLDIFLGSGTTAAVAQKSGRRWIGCDINKGAIQTTVKRLEGIITEQIAAAKEVSKQKNLIADETEKSSPPSQLSFAVHRVNDYDLAIQHNEAVNLACEHIGITRTRSDSFFDGSIGQRLAKIIPFGHPLSVPDLEDLKKELSARPNEERDVVVVCLGKELTVDAWLADWNRLRKRGDVPNKVEVIELRTDPKYGKFIAHQPARAKVDIIRKAGKLVVEIKDFISPSIIERLQSQAGLLQPKIDDWRAMVDCVMIDPAHDGKVFNIALADVPEKKTDFVQARYELDAPKGKTTVAVKITDMLGEEVLATRAV
jgi:DNA modification methylase